MDDVGFRKMINDNSPILRQPGEVPAEVMYLRGPHPDLACLLTEGMKDEKFFCGELDGAEGEEFVVFHMRNKKNVRKAITVSNDESVGGILGVVDRDFDTLEGRDYSAIIPNLRYMDETDFETAAVRDPRCFKKFFNNNFECKETLRRVFGSDGTSIDWISRFFQELAGSIGLVRWLSRREKWHFRFSHLCYESRFEPETKCVSDSRLLLLDDSTAGGLDTCIDGLQLTVDIEKLVKFLIKRSKKPQVTVQEALAIYEAELGCIQSGGLGVYCCGHDLTLLLSVALVYGGFAKHDSCKLSQEEVEAHLRQGFNLDKTQLRKDILSWQRKNVPYRFLNS